MVDQNVLVSVLVFGAVLSLVVFAYGFIAPMVLGRPHHKMQMLDVVLLAVFFALVILLMKVLHVWDKLVMYL